MPLVLACLLACAFVLGACRIERRGSSEVATSDTTGSTSASITATSDVDEAPGPDPNDPRSLEQHLRDASIAAQVKLALVENRQLRLLELDPEVRQGVVVLHGEVPSPNHAALATQIARGVPGVRAVRDSFATMAVDSGRGIAMDTDQRAKGAADSAVSVAPAESLPTAPRTAPAESEGTFHTVTSGESLWEIARENGTTVDAIKRLNNLQGDRLRPGQRLRVR